ncbi:MFS transporter [Rhodococcus pyridinivorans]|uniref:MFS transporter n=1 Tax=Rhodococcus pyridinivorans TaxID=103816 RepID=UPI0023799527|nr:MFS transporter [Rhodococcus pyridinivorans]
MEYYDLGLYGYMAVVIAPMFSPSDDPVTSLLSAPSVFGTAYLIRPLGGIVFGHIGDRLGRRKALMVTLIYTSVGSTAMGLLPAPAQIGVWATVLLVLIRVIQGFSAGGEVGGSATFISESVPPHLEVTYGSFTPLGSTGGFALFEVTGHRNRSEQAIAVLRRDRRSRAQHRDHEAEAGL